MNKLSTALLLVLATGCASTTPNYDAKFGHALRQAKVAMTINPDAGKQGDDAAGLNGKAAQNVVTDYQNSFKTPPPVVPVINIGGAISR